MRIAILADIHGNVRALEAVIRHMRGEKPDITVNLGDCFSGPLQAAAVADHLLAFNWLTVRGNHDRYLMETPPERMGPSDAHAFAQLDTREEDWLHFLHATARIPGEDVLLCHGTPTRDDLYLNEEIIGDHVEEASLATIEGRLGAETAGLILCGHSHLPRLVRRENGSLIVNPGSVGLPAYTDDDPWHFVETGTPHARYALADKTAAGWEIAFHQIDYDWNAAAKDACKAGRDDWAYALAKGRARQR